MKFPDVVCYGVPTRSLIGSPTLLEISREEGTFWVNTFSTTNMVLLFTKWVPTDLQKLQISTNFQTSSTIIEISSTRPMPSDFVLYRSHAVGLFAENFDPNIDNVAGKVTVVITTSKHFRNLNVRSLLWHDVGKVSTSECNFHNAG